MKASSLIVTFVLMGMPNAALSRPERWAGTAISSAGYTTRVIMKGFAAVSAVPPAPCPIVVSFYGGWRCGPAQRKRAVCPMRRARIQGATFETGPFELLTDTITFKGRAAFGKKASCDVAGVVSAPAVTISNPPLGARLVAAYSCILRTTGLTDAGTVTLFRRK